MGIIESMFSLQTETLTVLLLGSNRETIRNLSKIFSEIQQERQLWAGNSFRIVSVF